MRLHPTAVAVAFLTLSLTANASPVPVPETSDLQVSASIQADRGSDTAEAALEEVPPVTQEVALQSFLAGPPIIDAKPPTGSVVPEPSSYLLFGTGLLGMATAFRRRRYR